MPNSSTIEEFVEDYQDLDISYDTMHYKELDIFPDGEKVILLSDSVLTKYKNDLDEIIETRAFTTAEEKRYLYNPQVLSYDLYGSTQYWFLLLELNNMYSSIEFNLNPIKVYDGSLPDVVDTILALEEESININNEELEESEIPDVDDEMSEDDEDIDESEDDDIDEDEDEEDEDDSDEE